MDDEPLPLATYATILAHLVSRRGEPLERVLAEHSVSQEVFARAEAHFNERLRESHQRRKGILAMTFASAFAEARKTAGLFSHTGPIAIAAAAPAPAAEPTALPSYMNAPPTQPAWSPQAYPAAPALAVSPPAEVSAPQGPSPAAPAPAPAPANVVPPSMLAAAPSSLDSTTIGAPAPAAPPTPFRAVAPGAAPPPAGVATPAPAQASSGAGTGTQASPADAPRLPDTPWDQVKRTVGKLTLAHYAALTIELGRNPTDLTPILARYGLSSADDLRHVNAAFQTQLQFDPALKAQFDALIGRMRSMSRRDG